MNYDIIIVGAGPAGLSASMELTNRGINHAIIDPRSIDANEHMWITSCEPVDAFKLPTWEPVNGFAWLLKDHRFEIWVKGIKKALGYYPYYISTRIQSYPSAGNFQYIFRLLLSTFHVGEASLFFPLFPYCLSLLRPPLQK